MTIKTSTAWTHVTGSGAARVVVYEKVGSRMLTLRWWIAARKQWRRKSLGRTLERDRNGKLVKASVEWAKQQAMRKSVALSDGVVDVALPTKPAPFTIGETEAVLTDVDTGPYPHATPFVAELTRALTLACTVWGKDTMWNEIDDQAWTKLMRRRLAGLLAKKKQGIRSTEITVSRINTAAEWLRDQKKIPRDAALLPKKWRKDLLTYWRGETAKAQGLSVNDVKDPEVHRPRHTLEDMRKVLAAAELVDPRLYLLLQLAAEYRLGQARTAKRSHVNLEAGSFRIFGRGKKGGANIDLTAGQLLALHRALDPDVGYLAALERVWIDEQKDYYLFPSGKMLGRKQGAWALGRGIDYKKPVSREWIIMNFHVAEDRAGVKKIKGGAAYLLRRQNVDAMNAVGISGLGKQAAGGWSSTKVPDSIYAEETNKAGRDEAKRVRSVTRGEKNG